MRELGNRWFKGFMIAATVILLGVTGFGWHSQFKINNELKSSSLQQELQIEILSKSVLEMKATIDTLRETHPYMRKH